MSVLSDRLLTTDESEEPWWPDSEAWFDRDEDDIFDCEDDEDDDFDLLPLSEFEKEFDDMEDVFDDEFVDEDNDEDVSFDDEGVFDEDPSPELLDDDWLLLLLLLLLFLDETSFDVLLLGSFENPNFGMELLVWRRSIFRSLLSIVKVGTSFL